MDQSEGRKIQNGKSDPRVDELRGGKVDKTSSVRGAGSRQFRARFRKSAPN